MTADPEHRSRFVVVPRSRSRRGVAVGIVILWLLSVGGVFALARWTSGPTDRGAAGDESAGLDRRALAAQLSELKGRNAVLQRSDDVSRSANLELQREMSARDEQIATLRKDVAFYERLVSGTAGREGLGIHAAQLSHGQEGLARYNVTLTQTLRRTPRTKGTMTLAIEGVRDGGLVSLSWDALHQAEDVPPQPFEFRYFQRLEGELVIPADVKPSRLRIELTSDGKRINRSFDWAEVTGQVATAPSDAAS